METAEANASKNKGPLEGSFIPNLIYDFAIILVMAGLAWYAQEHNMTIADFNRAYASIPVTIVVFAYLVDVLMDTGAIYRKLFGRQKGFKGIAAGLGFAGLFFVVFVWLIAGTITLNLSVISSMAIVAAGTIVLFMLLPKTGTSKITLLYYIAVTIVTGFKYFTILPSFLGL